MKNTTSLVYDLEPGEEGSYPAWLTLVDSTLYFTTTTDCDKLWKLSGINNIATTEEYAPVINVYPVPVRDCMHVECPDLVGKKAYIKIYDHLGREVFRKAFDNAANMFINDLNNIDAGVYMLEISINNYQTSKKIIKINSR